MANKNSAFTPPAVATHQTIKAKPSTQTRATRYFFQRRPAKSLGAGTTTAVAEFLVAELKSH